MCPSVHLSAICICKAAPGAVVCTSGLRFFRTLLNLYSFETLPCAMAQVSNHYAAMPSMHFGYAVWVSTAIFGLLQGGPFHPRSPLVRKALLVLVACYPASVLFCILVRPSLCMAPDITQGASHLHQALVCCYPAFLLFCSLLRPSLHKAPFSHMVPPSAQGAAGVNGLPARLRPRLHPGAL